jgi:hypothetical protein
MSEPTTDTNSLIEQKFVDMAFSNSNTDILLSYIFPSAEEKKSKKIAKEKRKTDFMKLFRSNFENNLFMVYLFQNPIRILFFPFVTIMLLIKSTMTDETALHSLCMLLLGILCIKINSIISHMWAHAVVSEDDLWNETMDKVLGPIPISFFYAFQNQKYDGKKDLIYKALDDIIPPPNDISTQFAEIVSHSFFAQSVIIDPLLMVSYLLINLLFNSSSISFFLGYEIGVFILPCLHIETHYSTKPHSSQRESFVTDDLYCSYLNNLLRKIWTYLFDNYSNVKYQLVITLRYITIVSLFITMLVPIVL